MDTVKADKSDALPSSTSKPTRIPKFRLAKSNKPVIYSTESTFSNYQYTWLLDNFSRIILQKEPFTLDITQNGIRLWIDFTVETDAYSSTWLYYKAFLCHRNGNEPNHNLMASSPGIEYKLSVINKNKEKMHTIGKLYFA